MRVIWILEWCLQINAAAGWQGWRVLVDPLINTSLCLLTDSKQADLNLQYSAISCLFQVIFFGLSPPWWATIKPCIENAFRMMSAPWRRGEQPLGIWRMAKHPENHESDITVTKYWQCMQSAHLYRMIWQTGPAQQLLNGAGIIVCCPTWRLFLETPTINRCNKVVNESNTKKQVQSSTWRL